MDLAELTTIIEDLRVEGSDVADVEVKRANGGYPQSLAETMSAFANTPGGGLIVLGIDENSGFASVGVYDVAQAQAAITSQARSALDPPLVLDTGSIVFEGHSVVWARVAELDASAKPCRLSNGQAYLRSYDGDHAMADTEQQAFFANRSSPTFDKHPVEEASRGDLQDDLVLPYITASRTQSTALSRFSDDEVLVRTGVMTAKGHPTVAGLLAMGSYPQQFFPQLVIQGSVPDNTGSARVLDSRKFDGPIPTMLDEALIWVRRNSRTRIRFGETGHGRDEPEYPSEAIRELLSNSLVHRDLGPYALQLPISLRIEDDRLVLSNPGGLYGITRTQLGTSALSSTRNSSLARILERVRTPSDQRVVELVSSGIRTVLDSVKAAGMVQPQFIDQAIRFTVVMPNHALLSRQELEWVAGLANSNTLTDAQRHALVAMRNGTKWNNSTLRRAIPMDSSEARALLKDLVSRGLARAVGEKKWRVYELNVDEPRTGDSAAEGTQAPPAVQSRSDADGIPAKEQPFVESTMGLTVIEAAIVAELGQQECSTTMLVNATALSPDQIRYALRNLRGKGLVTFVAPNGRGPGTRYRLVDAPPTSITSE